MEKVVAMRKVLAGLVGVLLLMMVVTGPLGMTESTPVKADEIKQNDVDSPTPSPKEEVTPPPEVTETDETAEADGAESEPVQEEEQVAEDLTDAEGEETTEDADSEETEAVGEESVRKPAFLLLPEERQHVPEGVSEELAKLLVTSAEYYDEAVVNGAVVPVDSNDDRYEYITGSGYKVYTMNDRPSGFEDEDSAAERMTYVRLPMWKLESDGSRTATSISIQINKSLACSLRCIFSDMFMLEEKFPIKYLAGFMYRKVGGSGLKYSNILSAHSFGVAVDINNGDYDNDMYVGKGNDLRNPDNPYYISEDVREVFAAYGWNWGGDFDICSDTMHFQYFGLDFLQYDSDEPFPVLSLSGENMGSEFISNLRKRLVKLGYLDEKGTKFDKSVEEAVMNFQKDQSLEPDGVVDYETWVPLINLTHDMSYVF